MNDFEYQIYLLMFDIREALCAIAEELKTKKSAGGEGEKHEDNRI